MHTLHRPLRLAAVFLIMLLLSGVLLPQAAFAADAVKKTTNDTVVTTASINFRTGPGTKYSAIEGGIPAGATLARIGTNGKWSLVVYNGAQGWVSTKYVKAAAGNAGSVAAAATNKLPTKKERDKLTSEAVKAFKAQYIHAGMSDYDKANAIFSYLYNNVAFQDDQSNEAYKTNFGNQAYAALVLKKAACSGFCKAVTQLCGAAGLKSKHINAGKWKHQWNMVKIDGTWTLMDAQGGYFGNGWLPMYRQFYGNFGY
ncbi:MAG: SH3 domain-containing protein [Christensenellaceae bacterium]|jgi:hypothetical protein|nr:SH3 domain-containing protein [Christensenellaceae bacterium]